MTRSAVPPAETTGPHAGGGASRTWLRAMEQAAALTADPGFVLADLLDRQGETHGDRPALIGETGALTYAGLAARSRQYTRWALAEGLGHGDRVALLAANGPDYLAFWAGVSRAGVIVGLVNTNLRGDALKHGLAVSEPKRIVADPALFDAAAAVLADTGGLRRLGGGDLDPEAFSGAPLGKAGFFPAGRDDTALHIFTSGTTGLPKAARISHGRILSWIGWFAGLMDPQPQDRLYACLPMYHSVGGITGVGAMLAAGGSVLLREKFSATRFWPDLVAGGCTLAQYTGELWRYLLAAPPHADERRHNLRLICGNGLREEVWTAAQDRFAIPGVLEFYAATEGVFSLFNVEGRPGAIGRIPPFLRHRAPAVLVRYDAETGAPVRGADGACVPCGPDEVGEALGRVEGRKAGAAAFEGYTDARASEAKLLRDVFAPGDLWFRTGDLMRKDKAGFFYFVDRVGDTFRWKGENASTREIADILARAPGVTQAAVYGVTVPGAEGRAGMAALCPGPGFTLEALADHAVRHLPAHAAPVFLRLMDRLPTTETFKVKAQALAAEGFDPALPDPLYWFDPAARAYRPLDAAAYATIMAGAARL